MLLIKLLSLIDVIAAIILVVIFHKNLQIVRVNSRDPPQRVSTGIQAVSSDGEVTVTALSEINLRHVTGQVVMPPSEAL